MNTRETIKATCLQVLNGEKVGDKQAAEIAYGHLVWLDTRDLLLGATSDADANAEVVALIKAAKAAA